jgi:hypothetical protein
VSFKNTMVILTSNVGSRAIAAARGARPFGAAPGAPSTADADEDGPEAAAERARMRRLVLDEVRAYFRPELLNRFDDQVGGRAVRRVEWWVWWGVGPGLMGSVCPALHARRPRSESRSPCPLPRAPRSCLAASGAARCA